MILRDTVLTDRPRRLGDPAPAQSSTRSNTLGKGAAPITLVRSDARESVTDTESPAGIEKPLTLESVRAWLLTQDTDVRVQLAQALAPEVDAVYAHARATGHAQGEAQALER